MAYRQGGPGPGRRVKRVSDVAAMGMTSPSSGYPPAQQAPGFDQSFGMPADPMATSGYPSQPAYGFNRQNPIGFQQFGGPPPPGFNVQNPISSPLPQAAAQFGNMIQQPIVQDMAMQYGQQLASQGKQYVNREIEKYVPVSRLKYYFAVDTKYVIKKLLLIMFPFTHKDWTVKYEQENPVQPRYEINAPDLYIPTMAYITYIVLAGYVLGMQHKFSPEQLGIQASTALAYSIFEMCIYLITLYITNIQTSLGTFDLLSYSGYKYVIIISSIVTSIVFKKLGYYLAFLYGSLSLSFFLVRTLKVQVLSEPTTHVGYPQDTYSQPRSSSGGKRKVYFLLFVALMQPILIWWLTCHLTPSSDPLNVEIKI